MSLEIDIKIEGSADVLQKLRKGFANRNALHAEIAGQERKFFRAYVHALGSRDERHKTADGLGASRSNHYEKASARIEGESNDDMAWVRIPRATGLGRAFRDLDITPKNGSKYLTIPAHRTTYGKRAGEIPHSMAFSIVGGRHKALVFTSGPDKGSVAYWLRESVSIKRDASLLPDEDSIRAVAVGAARRYVASLQKPEGGNLL